MGRPTLPKGESKDVQIGVRFRPDDNKPVEKKAKDAGQTQAEWVRNAAIAESKNPPIWVKSKWQWEDLRDKYVEFRLTAPKYQVKGIGKFLVRINPRGELAIDICVFEGDIPYHIVETRYYLGQDAADKIEKHPNQKVAEFRLLA